MRSCSSSRSDVGRPKKNPALVVSANPAGYEEALGSAVADFEAFHGTEPKVRGSGFPILVEVGRLREVVYEPTHGERSGVEWFHQFEASSLYATEDGKELWIVPDEGEPMRFDPERGIVGG